MTNSHGARPFFGYEVEDGGKCTRSRFDHRGQPGIFQLELCWHNHGKFHSDGLWQFRPKGSCLANGLFLMVPDR